MVWLQPEKNIIYFRIMQYYLENINGWTERQNITVFTDCIQKLRAVTVLYSTVENIRYNPRFS